MIVKWNFYGGASSGKHRRVLGLVAASIGLPLTWVQPAETSFWRREGLQRKASSLNGRNANHSPAVPPCKDVASR